RPAARLPGRRRCFSREGAPLSWAAPVHFWASPLTAAHPIAIGWGTLTTAAAADTYSSLRRESSDPLRQPDRRLYPALDRALHRAIAGGLLGLMLQRGVAVVQLVGMKALDRLFQLWLGFAQRLFLRFVMLVD